MSVVAQLAIFPLDKGASLSDYVARVSTIIRESGLTNQLGPMGTAIEGEFPQVMATVAKAFEALAPDCDRVYMTLAVDYKKGRENGLRGKVESVEETLRRH